MWKKYRRAILYSLLSIVFCSSIITMIIAMYHLKKTEDELLRFEIQEPETLQINEIY